MNFQCISLGDTRRPGTRQLFGKETETAGKQSNRSGKGKQLEYGAVGRGRVSRHKQFE